VEAEVKIYTFLTWKLDGSEWSAIRSDHLTPPPPPTEKEHLIINTSYGYDVPGMVLL